MGLRLQHIFEVGTRFGVAACALTLGGLLLPAAAADREASFDRQLTAGADFRIVRFVAWAEGEIAPQDPDGHYRPRGYVTPGRGSDAVLGEARADYSTLVTDVADEKGKFTDTGVIKFASGSLQFTAAVATQNDQTPVPHLMQTVLIEKVTGGDGAFEEASGYFLMNVTLEPPSLPKREPTKNFTYRGTINGLIFIRKPTPPAK